MDFMEKQVQFGEWVVIDGTHGITFVPREAVGDLGGLAPGGEAATDDRGDWGYLVGNVRDYYPGDPQDVESIAVSEGWGARWSSPGYMDCTEWSVFDSEKEAQEYLSEDDQDDEPDDDDDQDDEPEDDDDQDADEPQGDDLVTTDYRTFHRFGFPGQPPVISLRFGQNWIPAVREYQNKAQYWVSVWLENERGGHDLLSLITGGFAAQESIPLIDVEIPVRFIALCRYWAGDTSCMLRAISSSGDLTLGTNRPYNTDVKRHLTDQEWHLSLWISLSCDVMRAARDAEKSGQRAARSLREFEEFAGETADRLRAAYKLKDSEAV
jgi:hypothetical protein